MAAPHHQDVKRRIKGVQLWGQQFMALTMKNYLLSLRNWQASLVRVLSPLIFMIIIYGFDQAFSQVQGGNSSSNRVTAPTRTLVGAIPACSGEFYIANPCYDFLYTPVGDPTTETLVAAIRANNPSRVIPASAVKGLASPAATDTWLAANVRQAQAAVHFIISTDLKTIGYGLQVNGSTKTKRSITEDGTFYALLPLQVAVEREIARFQTGAGSSLSWNVGTVQFAHPPLQPFSIVGAFAPTCLMIAGMFSLTFEVFNIVSERQKKLRQAMRTMGMMASAYWASWLFFETLWATLTALLITCFGYMFQFTLFLNNSFSVLYFCFWCYEFSVVGIMVFFSTLVSNPSASYMLGLLWVMLGFILQIVVSSPGDFPYGTVPPEPTGSDGLAVIFSFFSPALLAKILKDLGTASLSDSNKGIAWSQIDSYCTNKTYDYQCVFSIRTCYAWMLGDFILYFLLGMFFDNWLKDEMGISKPFYFFLMPSFWLGTGDDCCPAGRATPSMLQWDATDSDVIAEEHMLKAAAALGRGAGGEPPKTVEVQGLVRSFPPRSRSGKPFHAVKGNWFTMPEGELFCLLGPNGAGKTTTINMLTGVIPITAGDAKVYGISLASASGMDRIRDFMGVCPQFDLLWNELTGIEHLRLFGRMKGLLPAAIEPEAWRLLDQTKLRKSAGVESRSYSGGMKRRLSVAVALIGDPKVVYLDEPTTGMDPISRRHVWDIIEAAKPGRVIVLTTHSMEEADILGDRISIVCRGRLQCLNTSLRLKLKFGTGYNISVGISTGAGATARAGAGDDAGASNPGASAGGSHPGKSHHKTESDLSPEERAARAGVRALFRDKLGVEPFDADYQYLQFLVPRDREPSLAAFVRELEAAKASLRITDMQISLTTLEEIFLKIATKSELDFAREMGVTETLTLGDGAQIKVPVGSEVIPHPRDATKEIAIKWEQDEEGRLMIASHKVFNRGMVGMTAVS